MCELLNDPHAIDTTHATHLAIMDESLRKRVDPPPATNANPIIQTGEETPAGEAARNFGVNLDDFRKSLANIPRVSLDPDDNIVYLNTE